MSDARLAHCVHAWGGANGLLDGEKGVFLFGRDTVEGALVHFFSSWRSRRDLTPELDQKYRYELYREKLQGLVCSSIRYHRLWTHCPQKKISTGMKWANFAKNFCKDAGCTVFTDQFTQ